ncbi:MAG: transcription-repair coupling factor [Opitutales bacterium]|nr:transcription-repair coupling factor [Opitutales bacterium]
MKTIQLPDRFYWASFDGLEGYAATLVANQYLEDHAKPVSLLLLASPAAVESWTSRIRHLRSLFYAANDSLTVLSLPEMPGEDPDEPMPARAREELECDRLAALTELANFADKTPENRRLLIVTTVGALFSPLPKREHLLQRELQLKVGDSYNFQEIQRVLAEDLDYDAEAVCEYPGQFAVRGGLIDVYPLNATEPVRLDFFGDELDGIRRFDPTSQRSSGNLDAVILATRLSAVVQTREEHLHEYFGKQQNWLLVEPDAMVDAYAGHFTTFERLKDSRVFMGALIEQRAPAKDEWISISALPPQTPFLGKPKTEHRFDLESLDSYSGLDSEQAIGLGHSDASEQARIQLMRWAMGRQQRGERVVALLPVEAEVERFREILAEWGLKDFEPELRIGSVPAGFRWAAPKSLPDFKLKLDGGKPSRRLILLTARELLGRSLAREVGKGRRRKLPQRAAVDQLLDFSELADGDYLVHLSHGICQFRGLTQMEIQGRAEDVISVEFRDRVTLHVPLADAHLLTRYVGLSKASPKLAALGSSAWDKTRAAAEKATLDYAATLLKTQAERTHGPGYAFQPDSEWQLAFESSFPFTETPDQLRAIEEAKADMELPRPMDRLLCGDVGFGKTEIAIRAAFKAVMDGKQVVVLCPTTILAQQHLNTFRERMAAYPVTTEMLSRFRSAAQQKEIARQFEAGRVDILIGTHRVLSPDVKPVRLGLVVIDEEHRFGVRHKERLKQLKGDVDVLTMSATPIPRTLYMALMGARDLSVIETPPADRLPIETVVRGYEPELVKRAIRRELDRGGQIFYLHNRVQSIEGVAKNLQDWFPQAKIGVGHGQMTEHSLEKVMTRFAAGELDVLVCTTIIENGLDIPNCNTLIIEGADRFGLSQLYQLRGRVGRFKRQAYAYLLLRRHARILDQARERLNALRQHNQLGAGFRIAMRDLELRGAGNLLGAQQSGHIAGVGFDLYCQLLRQSIQRLKGDPEAARIRASVSIDFILDRPAPENREAQKRFHLLNDEEFDDGVDPVVACIPADYVAEARLRIDFYRQLAMASNEAGLEALAETLKDRFGPIPKETDRLLVITRIRVLAEKAGVQQVTTEGSRLKCLRAGSRRDDYIKIGNRFPRLTRKTPDLRLREIEHFLARHCR